MSGKALGRLAQTETARLLAAISVDGPGLTEAQLPSLHLPSLIFDFDEYAIRSYSYAQAAALR